MKKTEIEYEITAIAYKLVGLARFFEWIDPDRLAPTTQGKEFHGLALIVEGLSDDLLAIVERLPKSLDFKNTVKT